MITRYGSRDTFKISASALPPASRQTQAMTVVNALINFFTSVLSAALNMNLIRRLIVGDEVVQLKPKVREGGGSSSN